MKAKKKKVHPLTKWAQKIHWERRVKAVCKPCWEIKYCPYGSLVEDFLLKSIRDEQSCRIFGHDCPVFHVAEPLTETRELRNINRVIPRVVQFRVLKRENQICSNCEQPVKDEDIEFDHIIPWSKGGSSDENNVRLLCKACNRKKGKKFEDEYLVDSLADHLIEPKGIEVASYFKTLMRLSHEYFRSVKRYPVASDVCKLCGRRKVRYEDEAVAEEIGDINTFFSSARPQEMKRKVFEALKYRWGFTDREVHKLQESAKIFNVGTEELFQAELSLIKRLGHKVKLTETIKNKWLRI